MARIFISYSRHDSNHADRWYTALTEREHEVWMDRIELRAGAEWRREIEEYIQWSEAMVVMWSQHAQESKWVRREVELADSLDKTIIPLQIDYLSSQPDIIINSTQIIDARSMSFENVLHDIEAAFDPDNELTEARPLYHRQPVQRNRRWLVGAGIIIALVIIAALALILPGLVNPPVTVTTEPEITPSAMLQTTPDSPSTTAPEILSQPVTLALLNQWRTDQNLAPLTENTALMIIAQDHERYLRGLPLSELESTNVFRNVEGQDAVFMASEAGYAGQVRMVVEVTDAPLTLQDLLDSLGDDQAYSAVGLQSGESLLTGKHYFVLLLGTVA